MNDLTLDELRMLESMITDTSDLFKPGEGALFMRIVKAIGEREELESMDFNDCEGGACKL